MSETLTIKIENAVFHAFHGVFEQERKVGNEFKVSVFVEMPMPHSIINDDLNDTISYVDIYDIIGEEMSVPSKLLEHVAYRIIERIKNQSDAINRIEVEIIKILPPIAKMEGSAAVKLEFQKK